MKHIFLLFLVGVLTFTGCQAIPKPAQNTQQAISLTAVLPTPLVIPSRTSTPVPTAAATEVPTNAPTPAEVLNLQQVNVFPGPLHYEGDLLTFEIPSESLLSGDKAKATITIDQQPSFEAEARIDYAPIYHASNIVLPNLWDTKGMTGDHTVQIHIEVDNHSVDLTVLVELLPSDQRPLEEQQASWQIRKTECCSLYYIKGTAADRDINILTRLVDESMTYVAKQFAMSKNDFHTNFYILDNVWGNGGYATDEGVTIYYVDRDFGPGLEDQIYTTFRHEATHIAQSKLKNTPAAAELAEGMAVYIAGGHYYRQPIPQRAAALLPLGYYVPVAKLEKNHYIMIHEVQYLEEAAMVAYLTQRFGWENFLQFYQTELPNQDQMDWPQWLDAALQKNFDLDLQIFESDFVAWLQQQDPGDQMENLRLTVRLQEDRREYQFKYAPFQDLYDLGSLPKLTQIAPVMREATDPQHIAVETMIRTAQVEIQSGEYTQAETLIQALEDFLQTSIMNQEPLASYLAIAQILKEQGYDTNQIDLLGSTATAEVTHQSLVEMTLSLKRSGANWQMVPVAANQ